MVSVAPVSAPVAAKLAAVAAPEAVSVPVDTSPTVVKFPALAVLLMVSVLPVIPVAELSRPTLAAPLMLSELPDTAPVDDSAAPATVPVAVSAAQETVPEASTPVVNTSVQFTSLHSSWSQPTLPCAVSPDVRAVSHLSVVQDLRDIAGNRSFKHVYICSRRRLSPVAKASAKELSASYSARGSIPAASAVEYHSVRTPVVGVSNTPTPLRHKFPQEHSPWVTLKARPAPRLRSWSPHQARTLAWNL